MNKESKKATHKIIVPSNEQKETILRNLERRTSGRVKDYSKVEDAVKACSKEFATKLEQHAKVWMESVNSPRFKAKLAAERCKDILDTIEHCSKEIDRLDAKKDATPEILKKKCPDMVHFPEENRQWRRKKSEYSDIPRSYTFVSRDSKTGAERHDMSGKPIYITRGNIAWTILHLEHRVHEASAEYKAISSKFKGKYLDKLHKLFKK